LPSRSAVCLMRATVASSREYVTRAITLQYYHKQSVPALPVSRHRLGHAPGAVGP
jgi:hypothetical protein